MRAIGPAADLRHSAAPKARSREPVKIGVPFARAMGREADLSLGIARAESLVHIGADFEAGGTDRGAEPGDEVIRPRAEIAERRDCRFEHAGREPAPTPMGDAHSIASTVGKEHRQAIGGEDRANDATLARDRRVGDGSRLSR